MTLRSDQPLQTYHLHPKLSDQINLSKITITTPNSPIRSTSPNDNLHPEPFDQINFAKTNISTQNPLIRPNSLKIPSPSRALPSCQPRQNTISNPEPSGQMDTRPNRPKPIRDKGRRKIPSRHPERGRGGAADPSQQYRISGDPHSAILLLLTQFHRSPGCTRQTR